MFVIMRTWPGGDPHRVMKYHSLRLAKAWLLEEAEVYYRRPDAMSEDGLSFTLRDGTYYRIEEVSDGHDDVVERRA